MPQGDEHHDIQAFVGWVRKNSEYAILDPNSEERRAFIPLERVQEYFKQEDSARLNEILAAVFLPREPPVDPDDIIDNYAQIFCILVEIGKGRFIESFASWDIGDRLLPFDPDDAPPSNFPIDTGDPNFYEAFCNKQWKFCAPEFKSPMTNIQFHPERILPIVTKERIAGGGSGMLYKIKLHSSYNKLGPPGASTSEPLTNTYALKTYLTPDAKKYYENEVAAFRRLKRKPNPGLIGFYGCYIQAHAFNIILEFADKGNLENYFRTTSPPVRADDILSFWEGMFKTIWALESIHNVDDTRRGEELPILHGFHQDVKPANILVTSNNGSSRYKWQFKVADLGLSHFKKVVDEQGSVTGSDAQGTRCYGAPECYRGDEILELANLKIKQKVDIWSLGGIFSEAAIWIAHGYDDGILEYRRSRMEETDRIPGFRDGDCFHDGDKVLRAVCKWHKDILPILRNSDKITSSVLFMIELDMLVLSDARSSAIQLWYKAQSFLRTARQEIDLPNPSTKKTSPRQPPEMPSSTYPPPRPIENHRTPTKQGQRQVSWDNPAGNYDVRRDPSPDRATMFEGEGSGHSDGSNTLDGRDEYWEPSRSEYPGRRSQASVQRPRDDFVNHHRPDSGASHGSHRSLPYHRQQPSDQAHSERHRKYIAALVGGSENRLSQEVGELYNNDDVSHQTIPGEPNSGRGRNKKGPPKRDSTRRGLQQVNEGSGDSYNAGGRGGGGHKSNVVHQAGPTQETIISDQEIPYLSVAAALGWKTQNQSRMRVGFRSSKLRLGSTPEPLPHQYLQRRLEQRDQAFLIDDSASMAPYWQELTSLVGVLAYIVKSADPDGIEMFYTISSEKVKSKDSSALVKSVRKTKPQGISDIGMGLNLILGPYNSRLEKTFGSSSVAANAREDIRPLSLYVLTDGVWQPDSDAEGPIKDVVRTLLKQRKLNKKQVGIQFIRFGNESEGKRKLEKLDDDLTISESQGQLDIVDTEPSSGNVWKMLLGAIDPWFDRGGPSNHQPGSSSSNSH